MANTYHIIYIKYFIYTCNSLLHFMSGIDIWIKKQTNRKEHKSLKIDPCVYMKT